MNFAIFSTSRADFGILSNLIKHTQRKRSNFLFFIGGGHKNTFSGNTFKEILNSNILIDDDFCADIKKDAPKDISASINLSNQKLLSIFSKYNFDAVIILGDRYELLPIVYFSILFKKIIIHIGGGEVTLGAIDNQIRNMISKASHVHFVSCSDYKKNLIKMGEKSKRIFITGSLAVDQMLIVKNNKTYNRAYLEKKFNLEKKKIALITFHAQTIGENFDMLKIFEKTINYLILKKYQIVVTAPNLDPGFKNLINVIKKNQIKNKIKYFKNLGHLNYLIFLKNSDIVIGNSSSGITESPYFRVPTINIGERQKGRFIHPNIINIDFKMNQIISSIKKIYTNSFRKKLKGYQYRFGTSPVLKKFLKHIYNLKITNDLYLKE
jgi:GDP/UDP-N,N'-diacetylbacillosamine 2-epimerase (hydrolysing)